VLVGALPGLVALLALIESADVLGAKGWFEGNEGRTGATAGGDNPDEASLFGLFIGFGFFALYAACWLFGWRLRTVASGLLAGAGAALTVLLFRVAESSSLAAELSDSSKLACTLERPDFCAEGWHQTASTGRWGVLAFSILAALTCAVHLLLRLSGGAVRWMDANRF
jgi:hypothetical protein